MTELPSPLAREAPGVRRSAWSVGLASFVAAGLTWALQTLAGRALGPESFAAFMVVWGFVFLEVGLLQGLQQEVTRSVASDTSGLEMPGDSTSLLGRPMWVGLLVGGVGGTVILATSPVWGHRLFGAGWLPITAAATMAFVGYALHSVVNGSLAGRQRWHDYAICLASESGLRLVLVITAIAVGGGLAPQAWGLAGAGLTWVLLLGRRGFRAATREPGDRSVAATGNGAVHAMVATGCSALLIAGFPVLLKITASTPLPPEAGVVLAAVVATRAPLLLPLNAFQALLLTRFVLAREALMSTLLRLLGIVTALTVVGALLAYVVGPRLLQLLYGGAFRIQPPVITVLVVGAGIITMQTITGSAVIALGRHRLFAGGWVLATAIAAALLATDLSVGTRSALALTVGPLAGLLFNVGALALPDPT